MSDNRDRENGDGRGAKQLANVKPRPDHKGVSRDKHEQEKEKPPKVKRARSTDSERRGREGSRRRTQNKGTGHRRERGRSEEARRSDRKERKVRPMGSDAPKDDVQDTECVVCFCSYDNMFKTPKLLSCGHTFCLECLARINVSSSELKTLSCPVCRELTELPHGRDLPHLVNNEEVFSKLPSGMQKALSVRFKRNKGKLMLKKLPPANSTNPSLTKQNNTSVDGVSLQLGTLEQGVTLATVLDVGQPPSRVRGRMRQLFRSDQCYYSVVASVITITVALMLVGILTFVIMPSLAINPDRPNQTNGSQSPSRIGGHQEHVHPG
ncbi:E3 ubiquitin-protein ligase RNF183 [Hypomesus transpacificus]|uniref:E3 ubiquitin-protein ligase RNF183 n=1 Tax=Hypomesus transpacificus TaxID=137520 RepID=UPI001F081784|nr:E3 ubiquitin-protein ligase RNF183 [Hypomesus transpacificus]XP_046887361.1 E3 ubiquitin-protein ligase RNF183 [Hypomesus transpacificus]XP_046887369.1 E3 ubiquitin-protein ligase RNF183 [Hypomesus transpacificus]